MPNWSSNDPREFGWSRDFRGFVPFRYAGHDFPQGIHPAAAGLFTSALNVLVARGLQLPPVSMGLDAGMWGQEDRPISGSGQLSFHAYGLAIDVAAPWNPAGSSSPPSSPYRLPDNTSALVEPFGILWGGSPRFAPRYDRMHLECHLSPAEVAARTTSSPTQPPISPHYPLPDGYYYGPYEGPAQSISGSGSQDAPYRPGLARAQSVLGTIPDGFYGQMTASAARSWQRSHHLTPDGLIGPLTWRSLFP